MTKHIFIVERTSTGLSAHYEPGGIYAGGKTIEELQDNIVKALNMGLERTDLTLDDTVFKYDLRSFFEANGYLNAAGLAREIGMTKSLLTQYMSGNKKPSPTQAKRIFDGVHQLGRRLAEMEFAY